ncbi:high affinity copper uptake protein 1 [Galendromus occidentalis]|uniref:Copper transport protein n=1 Tax=Galendromus occidentalis TaxID=34638 RepID=A0AAJ6QZ05_9ACAR|nr:high affinity copper uptake protein 1 [Galendromus occidentalis]
MEHDHGVGYGGMGGMAMSFNFNVDPVLLFNFWHPKNGIALAGSCLLIFVLTVAFEALKAYREKLYVQSRRDSSDLGSSNPRSMLEPNHLKQCALYTLQITIGYLLMLLFMTYNGFVAITIIIGAGFGFLVSGWKKYLMLEMVSDHCG